MRMMYNKVGTVSLHKRGTLGLLDMSQDILPYWGHRETRRNPEESQLYRGLPLALWIKTYNTQLGNAGITAMSNAEVSKVCDA